MGDSEYDWALKAGGRGNAGRKLGAKRALNPQQVWAIRFSQLTSSNGESGVTAADVTTSGPDAIKQKHDSFVCIGFGDLLGTGVRP